MTSARIVPGTPRTVHHVILFRVDPPRLREAERLDGGAAGLGWPCFGGTGISTTSVKRARTTRRWVAAWAPGWGGGRLPEGTGVPLVAGSRIVMQVHYNLLNGRGPDRSRAVLTIAPATAGLTPLQTVLLPAPVELACAKGEQGRLCDRAAAIADLARKYGKGAGFVPTGLLILCRGDAVRHPAERDDILRPSARPADDDPRRRRAHAPARRRRSGSSSTPARRAPRSARHPALGLPLAERLPAAAGRAQPSRVTSCASPAATT